MWQERERARRSNRLRQRATGAGARHPRVFVDRLLATLVQLRHGVTHDVLAAWFKVHRSTITRAVNEIRPFLAERGCTVEGGVRLRTLADVAAYLDAVPQTALLDVTEIRVRRPTDRRAGRHQFISGKARQNSVKALLVTDAVGRLLFCGAVARGSVSDITRARAAGLVDLLDHTHSVQILADAGYQGLGAQTWGQVLTPPLKSQKKRLEAMPGIAAQRAAQRKPRASRRIRVEHAIAHLKNWRSLARHHTRRDTLEATIRGIAGLLSQQQKSPTPQANRRSHRSGMTIDVSASQAIVPLITYEVASLLPRHRDWSVGLVVGGFPPELQCGMRRPVQVTRSNVGPPSEHDRTPRT